MPARPWRLASSLITLRNQLDHAFPDRSHASDGSIGDSAHQGRSSDHNPWIRVGNHGVVSALDITHDPAHGVDGKKLVEVIKLDPRVKYVIFNKKIWNNDIGKIWRTYRGKNPHTLHFHVSVRSNLTLLDDSRPWNLKYE